MCFTESNSVVGDSAGVHTQELLLKTERLKNLITGWGVWDISLKAEILERLSKKDILGKVALLLLLAGWQQGV